MKLYTEKQLREILSTIEIVNPAHLEMIHSGHGQYPDTFKFTEAGIFKIIDSITEMKQPSDVEINEVAMVVYGFNSKDIKDVLEYKAFKRGAKWMRDKLTNTKE